MFIADLHNLGIFLSGLSLGICITALAAAIIVSASGKSKGGHESEKEAQEADL